MLAKARILAVARADASQVITGVSARIRVTERGGVPPTEQALQLGRMRRVRSLKSLAKRAEPQGLDMIPRRINNRHPGFNERLSQYSR
jgi:hypothetical protein